MVIAGTQAESYELGPIRPPSEAYSLLIRVTRNCSWNRCRFCPVYKGARFQLRPPEEVKRDIDTAKTIRDKITAMAEQQGRKVRELAAEIYHSTPDDAWRNVALWLYAGGKHAFLQDANTLIMKTADMVEVIRYLKQTFPYINRITCYARSKTAAKKSLEELKEIHAAGLTRLHVGLESGADAVLARLDKGVTAADHVKAGQKVVASGISLSEYVLLGAGGRDLWREHALETARVLNQIDPAFIRFRTLTINDRMLISQDVASGVFPRQTDDGIIAEEKLLIGNLDCRACIASDHMNNLLQEVEGQLPQDKAKMLGIIERYQSLPEEERDNYKLGRRLGIYNRLDDMADASRHAEAEAARERIGDSEGAVDEALFTILARYA
jgi:hypothetical protein